MTYNSLRTALQPSGVALGHFYRNNRPSILVSFISFSISAFMPRRLSPLSVAKYRWLWEWIIGNEWLFHDVDMVLDVVDKIGNPNRTFRGVGVRMTLFIAIRKIVFRNIMMHCNLLVLLLVTFIVTIDLCFRNVWLIFLQTALLQFEWLRLPWVPIDWCLSWNILFQDISSCFSFAWPNHF